MSNEKPQSKSEAPKTPQRRGLARRLGALTLGVGLFVGGMFAKDPLKDFVQGEDTTTPVSSVEQWLVNDKYANELQPGEPRNGDFVICDGTPVRTTPEDPEEIAAVAPATPEATEASSTETPTATTTPTPNNFIGTIALPGEGACITLENATIPGNFDNINVDDQGRTWDCVETAQLNKVKPFNGSLDTKGIGKENRLNPGKYVCFADSMGSHFTVYETE